MEVVHARCCGLDVHKKTVVACVMIREQGTLHKEVRTFGTVTADLVVLHDWLTAHRVTHVAMESSGIYWKPVYAILEGSFAVLLVNARHIKAVPGRKTDVKDAEWLADLCAHGLVRGGFVPPPPIRELRDLTRYRKSLIDERTREVNRLHKLLESANIKLTSVATNLMGVSGQAMLRALLEGTTDPDLLADLARGRLRKKLPELRKALEGRFTDHHRFMVETILGHLEFLDEWIERVSEEVAAKIRPFEAYRDLLDTIPGVNRLTAEVIIAEIGVDMTQFPTHAHLASWAGLCPGNHESAGKHASGKTRKGDQWLRRGLTESAHAAARTKHTYLSSRYHRLVSRRGKKKATIAVAHTILTSAYYILKRSVPYQDLGEGYLEKLNAEHVRRYHVKVLERLGVKVTIEPLESAA
jgi:transposase